MRFLLGLAVGLLALGGYWGYGHYQQRLDPCLRRCGPATECQEGLCLPAPEAAPDQRKKRRRRPRRWRRRHRPGTPLPQQPALKQPKPGDLRPVTKGPTLRKTEVVNLADQDTGRPELSTGQVDQAMQQIHPRIVGCIDQARGDYDIQGVRVSVGLRIEANGRVSRVRVTGPALMQRAGLTGCVNPLVRGLHFPRSPRATVMTYPFSLQ